MVPSHGECGEPWRFGSGAGGTGERFELGSWSPRQKKPQLTCKHFRKELAATHFRVHGRPGDASQVPASTQVALLALYPIVRNTKALRGGIRDQPRCARRCPRRCARRNQATLANSEVRQHWVWRRTTAGTKFGKFPAPGGSKKR